MAIGRLAKRIGKATGRFAGGGMIASFAGAGMAAGPVGMAGIAAAPRIARGIKNMPNRARSVRAGARGVTARTTARTSGHSNAAVRLAGRHPFATGALAMGPGYAAASSYYRLPNGNRTSKRSQTDPYLRRIRAHQQSSALAGLMGHSMGGYTGY